MLLKWKYWHALALGGAMVLYLFLAIYRLSRQDALPDEAYTLFAAEKSPFYLIIDRIMAGHVPLYFLLIHFLLVFKSVSLLPLLVAPSIAMGLGGLVVFYMLARRLELGGWSVFAAFLWAVHPSILYHCRLARPSAGGFLLECLILLLACRFYQNRVSRSTAYALLGVGIVGAFWIHLLVANWLVMMLLLLVKPIRDRFDKTLLPICIGVVLLHSFALALCQILGPQALSWIAKTTPANIPAELGQTWGGERFQWNQLGFPWFIAVALGITWIIAAGRLLFHRPRDSRWLLLYATALLPVAVMIVISLIQPMLHHRYLTHFVPPLILCLLHLLSGTHAKTAGTCSALLVLALVQYDRHHYNLHETGMRPAIQKIEEVVPAGNELAISHQITFPQMLRLFATRPHPTLVLEPTKPNEASRPVLESHLAGGGVLWEFNPHWHSGKLREELGATTGEPVFEKNYTFYVIRVYARKNLNPSR